MACVDAEDGGDAEGGSCGSIESELEITIKGNSGERINLDFSEISSPSGPVLSISVKCLGYAGICDSDFSIGEWEGFVTSFERLVSNRKGNSELHGFRGGGNFLLTFSSSGSSGHIIVKGQMQSVTESLEFAFELNNEFLQKVVEDFRSMLRNLQN